MQGPAARIRSRRGSSAPSPGLLPAALGIAWLLILASDRSSRGVPAGPGREPPPEVVAHSGRLAVPPGLWSGAASHQAALASTLRAVNPVAVTLGGQRSGPSVTGVTRLEPGAYLRGLGRMATLDHVIEVTSSSRPVRYRTRQAALLWDGDPVTRLTEQSLILVDREGEDPSVRLFPGRLAAPLPPDPGAAMLASGAQAASILALIEIFENDPGTPEVLLEGTTVEDATRLLDLVSGSVRETRIVWKGPAPFTLEGVRAAGQPLLVFERAVTLRNLPPTLAGGALRVVAMGPVHLEGSLDLDLVAHGAVTAAPGTVLTGTLVRRGADVGPVMDLTLEPREELTGSAVVLRRSESVRFVAGPPGPPVLFMEEGSLSRGPSRITSRP